MEKVLKYVTLINKKISNLAAILLILASIITFCIVLLRYVFNLGWVWLQDIVIYVHATGFLLASAYALKKEEHVRVDVFYQKFSDRKRAWINLLGTLLFLFPMCVLIFYVSWPYVMDSWSVFEGSLDGGGLNYLYLLKSLLLIFPVLLVIQSIEIGFRNFKIIRGKS